ncbi:3-oxoacyl-[acyl-carrier protein] reductase [Richelia intracellularis]|nr:3-oxoacyl-[acyl-carrier protein] reductase [Richelia intracellularis]
MLVRLDFQTAGYREKLAFVVVLFFSLFGLALGAILHILFGCDSFGSTGCDIRIINHKSTTVVLTAKNVLDGIGL